MKYICLRDEDGNEEIVMFSRTVDHDVMVESIAFMRNQTHGSWKRVHREPISAGFVDSWMHCHGRSETLNLDSRPDTDSAILKEQLSL